MGLLLTPAGNATRTADPLAPMYFGISRSLPRRKLGGKKCLLLVAKFGVRREKNEGGISPVYQQSVRGAAGRTARADEERRGGGERCSK